jgi:hypothetical protein
MTLRYQKSGEKRDARGNHDITLPIERETAKVVMAWQGWRMMLRSSRSQAQSWRQR